MIWLIGHKFVLCVLAPLVLFSVAVFFAATPHLRIEARTDTVRIDFSPGQPIAWAMGGAQLLDCWQLAEKADDATVDDSRSFQLKDGAEVVIAAIENLNSESLSTVRAKLSLDGNDVVVELSPLVKRRSDVMMTTQECSRDGSRMVVLDTGDGKRRGVSLPAQLRLNGGRVGNGLTLEFRGDLRVGDDITGSRQPLLTSGRLTLRHVRSSWLHTIADSQFDIESRDLGLGDKVTIAAPSLYDFSEDAVRGFVRIVGKEKESATEMSVYASAVAGWAKIVHPFSLAETPKSNLFRRAWADELLGKLVALFFLLISLHFGYLQFEASHSDPKIR